MIASVAEPKLGQNLATFQPYMMTAGHVFAIFSLETGLDSKQNCEISI
jgi:hypothetical protein